MVVRKRPLLRKSIGELEEVFKVSQSDQVVLTALAHELAHRSTARSIKLRGLVEEKLAGLGPQGKGDREKDERGGASKPAEPVKEVWEREPYVSPSSPQHPDEPRSILATWIALEALSPQTFRQPEDLVEGDPGRVARIDTVLPWLTGELSRRDYQLYYLVILGAVPMDQASDELVRVFGDDEETVHRPREKAAIGAVLIDRYGFVVDEGAVAVSSFAWALPRALAGDLAVLGSWPAREADFTNRLSQLVRRFDKDGRPLPLDMETVSTAHNWLVSECGLPEGLVEEPSFALRMYQYYKRPGPPELPLLNSFFINDLVRCSIAMQHGAASAGIRRYLGLDRPKLSKNLLSDREALEAAVAPAALPHSQWPAPGGHGLVLLQQAAVNIARAELSRAVGMIGVNGPPGTGKTTLLRDLVASAVHDRAAAMVAFERPEDAFLPSGQRLSVGDSAFLQLYRIHDSLRGHEVLVASSNNKAVENVSRELPMSGAVGRPMQELAYFKSVSDALHARFQNSGSPGSSEDTGETWGLISAVLGNARNRSAFRDTFWWDQDRGFRHYLKAAKGDDVVQERVGPAGERIRVTPAVVVLESPPTPSQAASNWQNARRRFLRLRAEVESELKRLEALRQCCLELPIARRRLVATHEDLLLARQRHGELDALLTHQLAYSERADAEHKSSCVVLDVHRKARPGFLARLFRTKRWKVWHSTWTPLDSSRALTLAGLKRSRAEVAVTAASLSAQSQLVERAQKQHEAERQRVSSLEETLARDAQPLADGNLIDETAFSSGHERLNCTTPWISRRLGQMREQLFIESLGVHRAFIDLAPQKLLHNLGALMTVLARGPLPPGPKRDLLADLWSSLFLVIPVISTTFASVDRMLGQLPQGSIGWLLIDEAGQALPQAAVGAIMRAKRTIVVGDPMQIPPVTTLPDLIAAKICEHFKVTKMSWVAPEASAQALADRASRFQAEFKSDDGPRRVGVPLLVHRRCQEPMFGMANRIAYDGQMVFATAPNPRTSIGEVLGRSKWFDIDGVAESKWCPAEGEVVVSLLKMLATQGVTQPDVFIISPFRIVAHELRRRLDRERQLAGSLRIDIRRWAFDRVGTIHTVQGREAEAVVLVLGAPNVRQHGARQWAAGVPNIVNVAVSRAKASLYVVGSYGAWSGVGYMRNVASVLPRMSVQSSAQA